MLCHCQTSTQFAMRHNFLLPVQGHSHVTSALWGKGVSSKADGRTDRLRDQDSDKGEAGSCHNFDFMVALSKFDAPVLLAAAGCCKDGVKVGTCGLGYICDRSCRKIIPNLQSPIQMRQELLQRGGKLAVSEFICDRCCCKHLLDLVR